MDHLTAKKKTAVVIRIRKSNELLTSFTCKDNTGSSRFNVLYQHTKIVVFAGGLRKYHIKCTSNQTHFITLVFVEKYQDESHHNNDCQ